MAKIKFEFDESRLKDLFDALKKVNEQSGASYSQGFSRASEGDQRRAYIEDAKRLSSEQEREYRERERKYKESQQQYDTFRKNSPWDLEGQEALAKATEGLKQELLDNRAALESFQSIIESIESEQKNRDREKQGQHNEWRSLTNKQLEILYNEKLKEFQKASKKGDPTGDLDADMRALKKIQEERGGSEDRKTREFLANQYTKFLITEPVNRIGRAIGPAASDFVQAGTTGVQTYSAARGAGIGKGGAGLLAVLGTALEIAGSSISDAQEFEDKLDAANKRFQFNRSGAGLDTDAFIKQGMSMKEAADAVSLYQNTGGRRVDDTASAVAIQSKFRTGLGLDEGLLTSFYKNREFEVSGTPADKAIIRAMDRFEKSGLINLDPDSFDLTKLTESFGVMMSLNQSSMERLGTRNDLATTQAITSFVNLGGIFRNPEFAGKSISNIQQLAGKQQQDPFLEQEINKAVYDVLPNLRGDYVGTMKARENIQNDPRLQQSLYARIIRGAESVGMNEQEKKNYAISALVNTGLFENITQADEFYSRGRKGLLNNKFVASTEQTGKSEQLIDQLSVENRRKLADELAVATNAKVKIGDPLVEGIDEVSEGLRNLLKFFASLSDGSALKVVNAASKTMKNTVGGNTNTGTTGNW